MRVVAAFHGIPGFDAQIPGGTGFLPLPARRFGEFSFIDVSLVSATVRRYWLTS